MVVAVDGAALRSSSWLDMLEQLRDAGLVIWNGGLRTTAVCPISLTVYHHSYSSVGAKQ